VVLNARLSSQSALGYSKIPSLTRDIFLSIHAMAAQTSADAERFIQLGLSREKITVTGNLKFDLELPADLSDKSEALQNYLGKERLIWIAASTHQGEEEIILAAHRLLLKKYPDALLILVPRHPDRFAIVAALAIQQRFTLARRSSGETCSPQTQLYLGDTMGELLLLYSVAQVAFVGGSFAQVGGHNMLEPAALHKPVVTGPVLFNFMEISEMLVKAQGMIIVQNAEELASEIGRFFADKAYSDSMGENAYQVVAANRGALQRQVELINSLLRGNFN
jgi:3-deoxy-D-manno-octulosonic-acid transferase